MAKITYTKLGLKVNSEVKTFKFHDIDIEVLQYLPIHDKYDLLSIALQKAEENGIYNELKLEMYFNLYLVYLYTNITFTDKQKEDEEKLYDCLSSNGFFDSFFQTMNEDEYNNLFTLLNTMKNEKLTYTNTAGAVLQSLIQDLPRNAETAAKLVDSFDPEKYKQVINFSKSLGNRS